MHRFLSIAILIALCSLVSAANVANGFKFARKCLGIAATSISLCGPIASAGSAYASSLEEATKDIMYSKEKVAGGFNDFSRLKMR
jgi:hypothetical protein